MLNIIYTEFLKLKRSKVLLLIPIGGLLPPLLNFCVMLNYNAKLYTWEKIFDPTVMLANLAMAVSLFTLLAGYVYSREYGENTVNTIFSYPISKIRFILAKLFVMYVLIAVVFAICFVMTIVLGMLLPQHDTLRIGILFIYGRLYFLMTIMHLALVPVSALLGLMGKSVIAPVTLGISAVFVNIVILSSKYAPYFPWCVPGLLSFIHEKFEPSVYTTGISVLAVTFVLGLAASIIYVTKSDVLSKN